MILHQRKREVPDFLYNGQPGESFELKTPFTPKPIIAIWMEPRVYNICIRKVGNVISYFVKN